VIALVPFTRIADRVFAQAHLLLVSCAVRKCSGVAEFL